MKKSIVIDAATMLLVVAAFLFVSFRDPGGGELKVSDLTGTWRLDSYKYGSTSGSFTRITPDRPHIKLITENSFLWATYSAGSRQILESAGGTYILDGDKYIESIDYGYNMDDYLGTKVIFSIKVEDGIFYMSGTLADGYRIEEIWQKIK